VKPEGHEDAIYKVDRIFDKVTDIASKALLAPCVVLLVAWVFLIGAYVFGRAIFNVKWLFVEEFTEYWLIMLAFFCLAYTLRTGGHITIDIVTRFLSKRVRSILAVITGLLALGFAIYLTEAGTGWFWTAWVGHKLSWYPSSVPLWPYYLFVPVGLAVLCLALLHELYRSAIRLVRGEKTELKRNAE